MGITAERVVKTTYVVYVHHDKTGRFDAPVQVPDRYIGIDADALPKVAFAFRYFDVITCLVQDDGREHVLSSSERLNLSPLYFVDAEVFTKAQLSVYDGKKAGGPLKYLEDHGHEAMVRTRHGNFEVWHLDPTKNEIINTK